jgi:hypothetical protein
MMMMMMPVRLSAGLCWLGAYRLDGINNFYFYGFIAANLTLSDPKY